MMGMEFFVPTEREVSELLPLLEETYQLHRDLDDVYYVGWDEKVKKQLENHLKAAVTQGKPRVLAAKEGDQCVGLILYQVEEGHEIRTHFKRCGVVIEVVVTDDRRGHGVGKQLLDRVEKEFQAEGVEHMKLFCSSANQRAHQFYEREGYRARQRLFCKRLSSIQSK